MKKSFRLIAGFLVFIILLSTKTVHALKVGDVFYNYDEGYAIPSPDLNPKDGKTDYPEVASQTWGEWVFYSEPVPGQCSEAGNGKFYSFCISPGWIAPTKMVVNRLLSEDNNKNSAIEYGMLSILRSYDLDTFVSFENMSSSERKKYVEADFALRGYNYVTRIVSKKDLLAHTPQYVGQIYRWLKEDKEMAQLYNSAMGYKYDYKDIPSYYTSSQYKIDSQYQISNAATSKRIKEKLKRAFQVATDYRNGDIKVASLKMKRFTTFDLSDDTTNKTLLIVSVNAKNISPENTYLYFKSASVTGAVGVQTVGYSFDVSSNISSYTKFTDTTDFSKIMRDHYKVKSHETSGQMLMYIAYLITTPDSDSSDCKTNFNVSYEFKDPSILEGALMYPQGEADQYFLVYTGDRSIKTKSFPVKNLDICGSCPPSVSLPQLCEAGLNPDKNNNVTYQYREGMKGGKLNVQRCVINKTDVAKNMHILSSVTSRYCTVSCKEDYTFKMPYYRNATNGRYFQLGMDITGTQDCYSSPIDSTIASNYNEDITDAQTRMIAAYNAFKRAEEIYNAVKKGQTSLTYQGTYYDYSISTVNGRSVVTLKAEKYGSIDFDKNVATYEKTYNTARADLKSAQTEYNNIIKEYNSCASWAMNYNFSPVIYYDYEEPASRSEKWINSKNNQMVAISTKDISTAAEFCESEPTNTSTFACASPKSSNTFVNISYVYCDESSCRSNKTEKITKSIYVHKSASKSATYDTPRVFYRNHINGDVTYSKTKLANQDLVNGLPVDKETPSGQYVFRISIDKLGTYYNTGELGRIYSNNSTSVIKHLKNEITVGQAKIKSNEYACYYEVGMCAGHSYDECASGESYKACIERVCKDDPDIPDDGEGKQCIRHANDYYVCNTTKFDSSCKKYKNRSAALKAAGCTNEKDTVTCQKHNFNCCPECRFKCTPPCSIDPPCTGPNCPIFCTADGCEKDVDPKLTVDFKTITPANFNPNNREMGYNWNSNVENHTNKLVAQKAAATVKEIQESAPKNVNNATNTGYTYNITLTPAVINEIREYNKKNVTKGSYSNNSLSCSDVVVSKDLLPKLNSESACEKAGYDWVDKKCVIQNAVCTSELLTKLANENKIPKRSNSASKFKIGSTKVGNNKTATNGDTTIILYTNLDINGDTVPDVGPAWK